VGHIAKYFQGDSFGMTDEKHEKTTHSVRFEVHTSVSINQVSGKPAATSFMLETPLKLKAEAEGSFETSKITYPIIRRRILSLHVSSVKTDRVPSGFRMWASSV